MIDILRIILDLVLSILVIVWIWYDKKSALMLNNMKDLLYAIFSQLNHIQMDQQQLAADLAALKKQTEKSKTEIINKIDTLEDAIVNAGQVSPEVQEALANLKTAVQGVDDIVPDAVELPAEEVKEETTEE